MCEEERGDADHQYVFSIIGKRRRSVVIAEQAMEIKKQQAKKEEALVNLQKHFNFVMTMLSVAAIDTFHRLQLMRPYFVSIDEVKACVDHSRSASVMAQYIAIEYDEAEITGTDTFKIDAWYELTLRGVRVHGYVPQKADYERLRLYSNHTKSIKKSVDDYRAAKATEGSRVSNFFRPSQ